MYRPDSNFGIGNLFMQITQLDDKTPVSSNVYAGFRGKYLKFKNLNIVEDDGTYKDTVETPLYINQHYKQIHEKIKEKVEPTEEIIKYVDEHKHLLDGVKIGLAIRFGVEVEWDICDEHAKKTFEEIIKQTDGNVFVACDSFEYKLKLEKKFGSKVRFLRKETVITQSINTNDKPNPYIEFFLLSMCPYIYLTGGPGGPNNFTLLSTFGYMAAIYGGKPFDVVWNRY